MPETPFNEDTAVCRLAESLGLTMMRFEGIEVYDETALFQAGLMTTKPDYNRIRKALDQGVFIQGARRRGVEYILRRNSHAA